MSEQTMQPEVPEQTPTTPEQTPAKEVEYTPLEQEMMEQGWKPRDQFEGEDEEFVTAAEYKRRGELFKKIADQNRRIERVTQSLTALQQHQKRMYDAGYDQALKELRSQHAMAVEEGDGQAAAAIVEKIEATKEAAIQARQAPVMTNEPPAAMLEFQERNSGWYQKDEVMTAYADSIGFKWAQSEVAAGRRPTVEGALDHVEKKVREKFPSAFGGKRNVNQPASVGPAASPARVAVKKSSFGVADLSADEQKAMKSFVRDGVMTEEEYLADIKKMRGIK